MLRQVNLVNAELIPQDSTSSNQATLTKDKKTTSDTTLRAKITEWDKGPPQPPQNVMTQLDPQQRKSFSKLWSRIPDHLRMIQFGLDEAAWQPQDINALGDTLCKFKHQFLKQSSTNLGHVTVDPFRIVLKQDARLVKQKPCRHSPFLAAKVRTDIDKLLLAGIVRKSYSNWASPLIVVAKSYGRIRLTCNYKKINEQGIFQSFRFQWSTIFSQNWESQECSVRQIWSVDSSNAPLIRIQFLSPQYVPRWTVGMDSDATRI